jgi:hypothetical protein
MDEIPISITRVDQKSEEIFQRLSLRSLDENLFIDLPDFPIKNLLP